MNEERKNDGENANNQERRQPPPPPPKPEDVDINGSVKSDRDFPSHKLDDVLRRTTS